MTSKYMSSKIARELADLAPFYDSFSQVARLPHDGGEIFAKVPSPAKANYGSITEVPDRSQDLNSRHALFFNANFNHDIDVQALLEELKPKLAPTSRIFATLYNPYVGPLYQLANPMGLRSGPRPNTFITENELKNICAISGYELVKLRPCIFFPCYVPLLSALINFIMPILPFFARLSLVTLAVIRPIIERKDLPSVSTIVAARNERGTIEPNVNRIPDFYGAEKEIIFIEGHSKDGTWEEIQRVQGAYGSMNISSYKQTGVGKSDAVRLGFSRAVNELIFILDADLTVPPEMLVRFYDVYRKGHGEFINGTRLIYPMESRAMRPLNFLGNKFFAKALSFVLDNFVSDSLCANKVFMRQDYARMVNWREHFGDFDPFGDFELLFPAAQLGFKIVDVPIHYKDRIYGETQISRFSHGFMLLKMTLVGLFKIKAGRNV